MAEQKTKTIRPKHLVRGYTVVDENHKPYIAADTRRLYIYDTREACEKIAKGGERIVKVVVSVFGAELDK